MKFFGHIPDIERNSNHVCCAARIVTIFDCATATAILELNEVHQLLLLLPSTYCCCWCGWFVVVVYGCLLVGWCSWAGWLVAWLLGLVGVFGLLLPFMAWLVGGWLVGWLVGLLVGWCEFGQSEHFSNNRLVLVGELPSPMNHRQTVACCFVWLLVGWLVCWLVGWLAGWLVGWLAGWFLELFGRVLSNMY
jgi:hypothetical protein